MDTEQDIYRPNSFLVTGGAGFVGANFVQYWLRNNAGGRVVVLDALTYAGNRENLAAVEDDDRLRFVQGDICDQTLVRSLLHDESIDTLVHFAAESHVDRSIQDPDAFIRTNVNGTYALLEAARKVWLDGRPRTHRFHHVSTDEVYGTLDPDEPPFDENHPFAPNSPYAASKAASDHLVRAYHRTFGLQATISNCSNNYGPYQFPEKLIPLVIANILDGKPLPIYGDGEQIRDWLYVDDHSRGVELILRGGTVGQSYNIGAENEWSNMEIVRLICRLVDERLAASPRLAESFPAAPPSKGDSARSLITHVRDRPGHDRRCAVNAGKITRELGYGRQESFESGITKTLDWYLANEKWWRRVMDGSYRQWMARNYG
jgi:dTDP-glucose 4,6-dehydratase